jgi:hypothetical protein
MRFVFALAFALAVLSGSACTTFNTARPLEPGQHQVSAVLGGPLLDVPGVGDIPMPNVTLEGRHGIAHHFDVGYGVQLLPLLFGDVGVHVGADYQFNDQPSAWAPALTVSEKLFGFSNIIDTRKAQKDLLGMSETALTASWSFCGDQLFYAGGTLYAIQSSTPVPDGQHVFLSPFAGFQFNPGLDWLRIQVEGKWAAPYLNEKFAVVDWIAPYDQGGIILDAGVAFMFGGAS